MEEIAAVVNCTPTPQPVFPDIRATDMSLKLKSNIVYLVAGIVIQDGKVLLIQECKISFKNKWYLPAGRMEKNESIVEAVNREVLEESGFEFEPEALIAVERMDCKRVRFALTGRTTGGSLKTKADNESVQAGWFTTDTTQLAKDLKLRNPSILPLIDLAAKRVECTVIELGNEWFDSRVYMYSGLPVSVGHVSSSQRLVLVHDSGQELKVILRKEGRSTRLPACLIPREGLFDRQARTNVDTTVRACGYQGSYRDCGVLSIEHAGNGLDGFCLTCVLAAAGTDLSHDSKFEWAVVSDVVCVERLRTALREDVRGCASFV